MQRTIYRYNINKAIHDGVFEAVDGIDSSRVVLYEWTPDEEVLNASRNELEANPLSIDGTEVFSHGASLYLTAPSQEGAVAALQELRGRNLFTGNWPQFAQPAVAPATAAASRASVPDSTSGNKTVVVMALLGMCVVCSIIAFVIGNGAGTGQEHTKVVDLESQLTDARNSLTEEQGKRQSAEKQAETAKAAQQQTEESVNNSLTSMFADMQNALARGDSSSHLLRITNECKDQVSAAVNFRALNGQWVTEGWWVIKTDSEVEVAPSESYEYYVYAHSDTRQWEGNEGAGTPKEIELVDSAFVHAEASPLYGPNKHPVKVYPYSFASGESPAVRLTCGG